MSEKQGEYTTSTDEINDAMEMLGKGYRKDHNALAWEIYRALKDAGAEIGNASVAIIERVLDEADDEQRCPDHQVEYVIYCPVEGCGQPKERDA